MNAQFREIPNLLISRWNKGDNSALARIYESHYARLEQRAEDVIFASKNPTRYNTGELVHVAFFRLQRCHDRSCRTVEQLLNLAQRLMQEYIAELDAGGPSWMAGVRVLVDPIRRRALSS
jgi:hypothetical protein